MSTWFRLLGDGSEQGPLTFQKLAELVARGELSESDRVRREDATEWQGVNDVIGLRREAAIIASGQRRSVERAKAPKQSADDKAKQTSETDRPDSKRQKWIVRGAVCCILLLLTELFLVWWSRPERYPHSVSTPLRMNVPSRLDQMLPPVAQEASVPTLLVNEPMLVPGLEEVGWMKQATLSADMLTVVFVSYSEETLDDLYIASRPTVDAPFSDPQVIEATVTPEREALPALSPDGLELIYTVLTDPMKLMHTRRESREKEFPFPRALAIEGDLHEGFHHDGAQFMDDNHIRFTVYDTEYKERHQIIAERVNRQQPFRMGDRIAIFDHWPRLQLGPSMRRIYFPTETGIYISARASASSEFVTPELLLDIAVTGPDVTKFDGSIWIAPKEDVIFYCSPGPGEDSTQSRHRLWMVRLQ